MAQKSKTLEEIVSTAEQVITYVPLRGEVDFRTLLKTPLTIGYEIQPRASLDPYREAESATRRVADRNTCILLPGRSFDAHGTRHGQGGGWYDRFLALVPTEWKRIGFCYSSQFCTTPLQHASHDQSVDYVIVVDREKRTYKIFVTNARPGATIAP